jgi:ElaB/YqjD/DUF883 family membrane-anchored ribosome-binding protein
MSRNDPFGEPTGLPGNRSTTEQGTARVETRLTGAQGTDRADELVDRATDRARETADQVRNRAAEIGDDIGQKAREWGNEAQEQIGDLKDRASGYVSRARGELDNVIERAEDRLEEQTGAISLVRGNPLLAAGLAFGVGFMLAGDGGRKRRKRGMVGRATGSIRSAVVGGVSTMLMQELQEMMDEHGGPIGLLNTITGRGSDQQQDQPQRPQQQSRRF